MKPNRYVTLRDGRTIHLTTWAQMNGISERTMNSRWDAGIRDPETLALKHRIGTEDHTKPSLTPEKKKEMIELARYSMGQPDQGEILCDLLPCDRRFSGWLMKELGLA